MSFFAETILPLAISSGANLVGNAMNRKAAFENQKRQMDFNLKFWNMQNEYNSPEQQMQRFRAAGLNPNLIYGSGSASAGTASLLSAPDLDPAASKIVDPQGIAEMTSKYFDWDIKQAQYDNIRADTATKYEEKLLKSLQAFGEMQGNVSKQIKAQLDQELFSTYLDHAKESLRKLRADTQSTLDANERAQIMLEPNLKTALENIINMRTNRQLTEAQIRNLNLDSEVKKLNSRLAEMGVSTNDPLALRWAGILVSNILEKIGIKFNLN